MVNIISLSYIIYIVFTGISLFTHGKLVQINLDFLPNFRELRIISLTTLNYLANYFSKNKFINYAELKNSIIQDQQKQEKALELKLKTLPSTKKFEKYHIYLSSLLILAIMALIILFSSISGRWLLAVFVITLYTI